MTDEPAASPKTRRPRQASVDAEAAAIAGCAKALTALSDKAAKLRVIEYCKTRFGL